MVCPASSGGTGLRAASQVVWRPARDGAAWAGLGLADLCQSTGSQLGQPRRVPCLDRPGLEDPGLRNGPDSGHPSEPG